MGAGPLVWGREGPPDGLAIGHSLRHYTRRRRACFVPCLFALLRRKKSDALWILVLSDETCLGVIMFCGLCSRSRQSRLHRWLHPPPVFLAVLMWSQVLTEVLRALCNTRCTAPWPGSLKSVNVMYMIGIS